MLAPPGGGSPSNSVSCAATGPSAAALNAAATKRSCGRTSTKRLPVPRNEANCPSRSATRRGSQPGARSPRDHGQPPVINPLPEGMSQIVEWIVAGRVNREEGEARAENVVERNFAAIPTEDVGLRQGPSHGRHASVLNDEAAPACLLGTEPAWSARYRRARGQRLVVATTRSRIVARRRLVVIMILPRRTDSWRIASRVRAALRLVGLEERRASAPPQRHHELPDEVVGVTDAGIEAGSRERRHHVRGVPQQEAASHTPALSASSA